MRKSDGSWLKPPPPYPCIQVRHLWNQPALFASTYPTILLPIQLSFHPFIHRFIQGERDKEENEHNLEDFISMEPGEGRFGEVWDQSPSFTNNTWLGGYFAFSLDKVSDYFLWRCWSIMKVTPAPKVKLWIMTAPSTEKRGKPTQGRGKKA